MTARSGAPVVALLVGASTVALLAGCGSPRLPAGFPAAVPVIGGPVLATSRDTFDWHVWIASKTPLAAYRAARSALLRAGYEETHDDETPGGSDGQFCDPTWCVAITGYKDPDHGDSVMYDVARTSGMGDPIPLPS